MSTPVNYVLRMLRLQIQEAAKILRKNAVPSDREIHDTRRMLKRARANLRIVRYVIGKRMYQETNAALQEAGKSLSQARDAFVLLELLRELDASKKLQMSLSPTRDTMRARYDDARRSLQPPVIARVVKQIESAEKRIRSTKGNADEDVLTKGLRELYRKGRESLTDVSRTSPEARLHETRKQAKYLELALENFEATSKGKLSRVRKRAKKVETKLGKERDLAKLHTLLEPALKASDAESGRLIADLEESSEKQRRAAMKRAHEVYRPKPKKVGKRFAKAVSSLG